MLPNAARFAELGCDTPSHRWFNDQISVIYRDEHQQGALSTSHGSGARSKRGVVAQLGDYLTPVDHNRSRLLKNSFKAELVIDDSSDEDL